MAKEAHDRSARHWVQLQTLWTAQWHDVCTTPAAAQQPSNLVTDPNLAFLPLLESEHRANFDLWHQEDKARDPAANSVTIATVKHRIDTLNQQRNDAVERMDEWLIEHTPFQHPDAVLHSETPGMILDRLSILALKIFHTREETDRTSASESHRANNRARLATLEEQRRDLADALEGLLRAIARGERRIKMYRQMKMYNDPELNPAIYGRRLGGRGD